MEPRDIQSYLLSMLKPEPFKLQGWKQLGVLPRNSQASAEHHVAFQVKKHSKEKWRGKQRKRVGKGKELGWKNAKARS